MLRNLGLAGLAVGAISLFSQGVAAVDQSKDPYEDNLLGHWGGWRDRLSNVGVEPTIEYKADLWSVTSGGIKPGNNYMDNLDVKLAMDGEKLLGIPNNKALIYFLNNNGGKPNAHRIGSVQGIDNIEVGTNSFKLYEAWDEQTFLDNKLALLVGLHDLNSEFDETDVTANFLKPVMQIGQTFAQSGENGPSIFPNTSFAARVKFMPTEASYLSVAAFDGVPGNVNRRHGTHIDFERRDGLLLVAESGYRPQAPDADGAPNKFAVGGWMYTERKDDLVDVDASGVPVRHRMAGAYFLSSYQVYQNKDAGRNIAIYLRGGIADGNTTRVDWDYESGIVATGWIPTRTDGEIGLGISQAHNSDKYLESVGGIADRNEYSFELYYRDKLYRGVSVQPDVQYVINPGTDKVTPNATVLGMRFDINF